jgi:hypothetical protein
VHYSSWKRQQHNQKQSFHIGLRLVLPLHPAPPMKNFVLLYRAYRAGFTNVKVVDIIDKNGYLYLEWIKRMECQAAYKFSYIKGWIVPYVARL